MCDIDPDADAYPHADTCLERSDCPGEPPAALVARIRTPEDGPAECTLHPRDATGLDLMTTWITAAEGGYVALEEMR